MSESTDKPFWTFDGRARRSEYWHRVIINYLLFIFVAIPLTALSVFRLSEGDANSSIGLLLFSFALLTYCSIAMWPVTVRRLHDRNLSGWWILWFCLIGCVPVVGWAVPIVMFAIVGCMDGTPGPNDYGPDPKNRAEAPGARKSGASFINIENNVSAVPKESVEDRLRKLDDLKARGLLTDEEYAERRKSILEDL